MTPEDAELRRRVDGLFVSYGEVLQGWGRVETRADGIEKQVDQVGKSVTDGLAELKIEIRKVDQDCENWHNEYRKDRNRELEGRISNKTIVIAMIGGSATVLAAIIAAAAVILTGGH